MQMYQAAILDLIDRCQVAKSQSISLDEIRHRVLPENAQPILSNAADFLNWIRDERDYSFYYYEAQQSGVCAKPVEAAAMILEAIILEAIE
jgi:hypothetical protein